MVVVWAELLFLALVLVSALGRGHWYLTAAMYFHLEVQADSFCPLVLLLLVTLAGSRFTRSEPLVE